MLEGKERIVTSFDSAGAFGPDGRVGEAWGGGQAFPEAPSVSQGSVGAAGSGRGMRGKRLSEVGLSTLADRGNGRSIDRRE